MHTLRWALGAITAAVGVVWMGFFLFANNFRRSFGASPNAGWQMAVPLAVGALVIASTLLPGNRIVLHLTTLAVAAMIVGCLSIFRPAPILASMGLLYAIAWTCYYISLLRNPA